MASRTPLLLAFVLSAAVTAGNTGASAAPVAVLFVDGLAGGSGSTIGPGGALFVPEPVAGRISRVEPTTGEVTTFATGLPPILPAVGIGGVMDVAFIGSTAYALVTLVGTDVGGNDVVGIYRIDSPNSFTVIADIGAFAQAHPPVPPFFVPTGVQYAIETFRGGFLVTDGHHNRMYHVTLDGTVSELIAFPNIVPTGLAVSGNTVYMGEAGPVPHLPENGRIVTFSPNAPAATELARGARLLVDVEFGRGRTLFGLSQGFFKPGNPEGSPAEPNTGALMRVNSAGSFDLVTGGLDRPTSLEFIGNTAYVVSIAGKIWKIEGVAGPPYGR
jgi:hypothetical protein